MNTPKVFPRTILVDSREQAPYRFSGLKESGCPLIIRSERRALDAGDYSLDGLQDHVAVERKSLEDFMSCCGIDRDRFERQLIRLDSLDSALIVVEGDEFAIRTWGGHGPDSRSVLGSIDAWEQRLSVRWYLARSRQWAEAKTFRFLRRYLKDWENGKRWPASTSKSSASLT